jgi:aspartate kinase
MRAILFGSEHEMGLKVCKFGGTSVADAGQLRKVKAIVEADPERRHVVPSAPGKRSSDDEKVTDLLYGCHNRASAQQPIDPVFQQIVERYRQIIADLGLKMDLSPHLDEVARRISEGAGADYAASRGEYLNGQIVANLLGFEFIDAADIIHFDSQGRFDAEWTQDAVSNRLANVARSVVPGFYGALPDGSIKTFSRGGTDITGAIVARGVGADVYENWTDVSGLLMADPRIVNDPGTIDLLSYRELRELAYMGATVLHDEAIFPVREAGIPVHIRNTNDPDAAGTRIVRDADETAPSGHITGIAGRKDFTIIALEKTLMNAEIGFGRRLLDVLDRQRISWEHIPSGIDTLSIVIKDSELEGKLEPVLAGIQEACHPDSLETYSDIALIATVGRGMMRIPGMAARLFAALAEAGVNVRMIDQGSSELNIIVGVDAADFETSVRAIYESFTRDN